MNAPAKTHPAPWVRQPGRPEEGVLPPAQDPETGARRKHRILVLDDHPLFRFGLKRLINAQPDLEVCGEAGNAVAGLDEALRLKPDMITVDISLNESTNGIEFVKNIRAHLATARILVLSMHDESIYAVRALRAGAQGYLMKEEVLARAVEAIRTVAAGGVYLSEPLRQQILVSLANGNPAHRASVDTLSDRELEVLQLSGQARTPREIANQLGISVKTVETHRMRIRRKLNLAGSAELNRFAIEWCRQNSEVRQALTLGKPRTIIPQSGD